MSSFNSNVSGKLFSYFKSRLKLKKSTKGWWRCDCPYCGRNYSMGISVGQRRVHCFGCERREKTFDFVMYLEDGKLQNWSQVFQLLNINTEYEPYEEYANKQIKKKEVQLPKEFTLINMGKGILPTSARNYLKNRGFNIESLAMHGVGYCETGKYCGYIIFPVFKNGKLIFFQGRRFIQNVGPKMQNPELEEFGIGKTEVIYNADALFLYNKIYVVESITNALTIGDKSIAFFGKAFSELQLKMMIASPIRDVVIILDEDATDKAIGLGMQLAKYKSVKIVVPPPQKDVNDLGRKQTLTLEKAVEYLNYSQLFRMKLNHQNIFFTNN